MRQVYLMAAAVMCLFSCANKSEESFHFGPSPNNEKASNNQLKDHPNW